MVALYSTINCRQIVTGWNLGPVLCLFVYRSLAARSKADVISANWDDLADVPGLLI